ncbi:hypothetical protein ABFA07_006287 [Porites harrisoni]
MARLPNRPPSVCALSPQELSYETVDVDKVYIPTNALLIAENESIFLAIASILKDRKAVLIGGAGYIYYGKINSRLVFLLKARGEPSAVVQAIKSLKPKAGIFLGFGKCPHNRPYEIGDVIVAEAIARKNPKFGKLENLACSECLINVFENGKYGWKPPKYRKQAVHVGKVFQMGDFTKNEKTSAVAVKTSRLDILECCEVLGKEWISIVGVIATQRYHGNTTWKQYVAAVLSSLVNKVLQDDQVFAILGGEGGEPRRHSPLPGNPLQETVSLKTFQLTGSDLSLQEGLIRRQADMHWTQVKDAYDKGFFHLPGQHKTQSDILLQEEFSITPTVKSPVENSEELTDKANSLLAIRVREQASNDVSADGKPTDLETGSRALFREPNRFTLPPLRSLSAGNRRTSLQDNLTSHAQTCPTLTSSMAVTMQAALLPISTTLQTHGSCLEIIRIKTEERATVSRQGVVLPSITRQKKRV